MTAHIERLFQVEGALLAFILAFYALCARERRAPYITHTVYNEIGLTLLASVVTLLALIVPPSWTYTREALSSTAVVLVVWAILATLKRVYSIANRDLRLTRRSLVAHFADCQCDVHAVAP